MCVCVDIYINSISNYCRCVTFFFFLPMFSVFCSIASIDLSELSDCSILSCRSLSCLFMNIGCCYFQT